MKNGSDTVHVVGRNADTIVGHHHLDTVRGRAPRSDDAAFTPVGKGVQGRVVDEGGDHLSRGPG